MATEEKWVLNRTMHLGGIRQTYPAGTLIVYDEETDSLKINGKVFEDSNDLAILVNNAFVDAYSPRTLKSLEEQAEIDAANRSVPVGDEDPKNVEHMKVVKSDEDLMEKEIDIRYTIKAKEEPKKKRSADEKLPVIRGDESPEERTERLLSEKKEIPVISEEESSDQFDVGNGQASLNQGQVKTAAPDKPKRRGRPKGSKDSKPRKTNSKRKAKSRPSAKSEAE